MRMQKSTDDGGWRSEEMTCKRRFSDTKFCLQNPPSEHWRFSSSLPRECALARTRAKVGPWRVVEGVTALLRRNGLPTKEGRAPEGGLPPRSGCKAGGTGVCRGAGAAAHAVQTVRPSIARARAWLSTSGMLRAVIDVTRAEPMRRTQCT